MLSECKGDFEDVEMSYKIDEFLHAAGLPTNIDVISDSTGDSGTASTPQPPHFPYESVDFNISLEA
jgi:hypothetical protein